MNIAPGSRASLGHQRPTYLLAPNFTTRPFPNGPLDLGTVVEDLKDFYPITQGLNSQVEIPAEQRYSETKEDVVVKLNTSRSGEAGFLAHVLDRSIGGDISLKGQKSDEDIYTISKLQTLYFYPQLSYIRSCLQLSQVQDYLELSGKNDPVYLITGVKLAWGATISTHQGRSYEGVAEQNIAVPGGVVDVSVGAKGALSSGSEFSSTFGKPADFVLGIQVQKIYHKRKFLSGQRILKAERVVKKAVLVDDEALEADSSSEFDFVVANLDEADVADLLSWEERAYGQDTLSEKWLLPSRTL